MASGRMIALLGLLAVAGYQNRDKLGELLGRVTGQGNQPGTPSGSIGVGTSSTTDPATRPGLGGLLGGIFGGDDVGSRDSGQTAGTGISGFLGNLFGGGTASAGTLTGGIRDLIDRFSGNGHADEARSWVETGANSDITPASLSEALGEDTITELTAQTGLSRQELLDRLRTVLPTAVDKLTPEGRVPTEAEITRWAGARGSAA